MNPTMINFEGKAYPTRFGFGAIEKWENEVGLKISEIGDLMKDGNAGVKEISIILKLAFYGLESGCRREKVDYDFTMEDFIDGIEADDLQPIIDTTIKGVMKTLNTSQTENKRLPKKK